MSRHDSHAHKRSRVGLIVILVLIAAAIAVVVLNPFKNLAQFSPDQGAATQTEESSRLAVRVHAAETTNLRNYIKVNGNVVDTDSIDIYPEVAGKLSYIGVRVGDHVETDQVIARVDPSRPGANYRETDVKSPVAGTVLAVNFTTGATVSPQAAIVNVGMLEDPEVEVAVAERHIGSIKIGTEVEATFVAYPNMIFSGEVVRLSPALNPMNRTLTVGIRLQDPGRLVKAGMFPSVLLYTEAVEDALIIDRSSILYEGNQPYVYIVDEQDQAQKRTISLGLVVDTYAEVIDGLSAGGQVVIQGQTLLTDGTDVLVVD